MQASQLLHVFIGHDSREAICSDVLKHSIQRRTQSPLNIQYLKHRELRAKGLFKRKWSIDALTGEWIDDNDTKKFSTEFSHTRFLVPALMQYKGWALFCDSDMIFLSDIKKLFELCDNKYAVMCVKHQHKPKPGEMKMDGRVNQSYPKKNWSSFVLFNCGHPSNRKLTPAEVGFMTGAELHNFSWLHDTEIGGLPTTYNFIPGISPKMPAISGGMPEVIHYSLGGPWFPECQDVPYAGQWLREYEEYQSEGHTICDVPTVAFDSMEDIAR